MLLVNATRGEDSQALDQDLLKSFQTSIVRNIHLINQFMPLIPADKTKR